MVVLLRHLVVKGLALNAHFMAVHVPGVRNCIADALSRFQEERLRELAPVAGQCWYPVSGFIFGVWFEVGYGLGAAFP